MVPMVAGMEQAGVEEDLVTWEAEAGAREVEPGELLGTSQEATASSGAADMANRTRAMEAAMVKVTVASVEVGELAHSVEAAVSEAGAR